MQQTTITFCFFFVAMPMSTQSFIKLENSFKIMVE